MKIIMLNVFLIFLLACSRPIPVEISAALDKRFSSQALEKGWKFTKVTHGFGGRELVVDILVDEPLKGDPLAQQQFLKAKVCPAPTGNDDFWQKLPGYKLSIAAYTHDRKFTLLVDCENPYQTIKSTVAG